MNQNSPTSDYHAPGILELTRQHGRAGNDPLNESKGVKDQMTRAVARRLLPACVIAPTLLWWVLTFGVHRGWYSLETCFISFVTISCATSFPPHNLSNVGFRVATRTCENLRSPAMPFFQSIIPPMIEHIPVSARAMLYVPQRVVRL